MFGKDKESKEFFEVFKKKPQEQGEVNYSSKTLQREQVNPTVLPRPNQKKSQEATDKNQNTKQMGWIKDTQNEDEGEFRTDTQSAEESQYNTTKKPRRLFLNDVVVKQETLIFCALGAVFLSLACFFIGYKIGNKDVLNPEVLQNSGLDGSVKYMPRDKELKAVNLSPPQKVTYSNTKWTLQIISYSNTKEHIKKARDLAKAIKNMTSYNTFVAKRGNELVVCMGKFNSKDSNDIKRALKEISRLEYEGKKQFTSSYPIQVR